MEAGEKLVPKGWSSEQARPGFVAVDDSGEFTLYLHANCTAAGL